MCAAAVRESDLSASADTEQSDMSGDDNPDGSSASMRRVVVAQFGLEAVVTGVGNDSGTKGFALGFRREAMGTEGLADSSCRKPSLRP